MSDSKTPAVLVDQASKWYGQVIGLNDVSLAIDGGVTGVLGPNGAGKSTLMMTICGNPQAREGRILFEGRDITQMPTWQIMRMKIAQSPEGRRIFPRMTVFENLQMGAATATGGDFKKDLARPMKRRTRPWFPMAAGNQTP